MYRPVSESRPKAFSSLSTSKQRPTNSIYRAHPVSFQQKNQTIYQTQPYQSRLFTQDRVRRRVQGDISPGLVVRGPQNHLVPQPHPSYPQFRPAFPPAFSPASRTIYPPPQMIAASTRPQKIRVFDGQNQIDINLNISIDKTGRLSASNAQVRSSPEVEVLPRSTVDHMRDSKFSHSHDNYQYNWEVEEQHVYCVICNNSFLSSEKERHLEMHKNKVQHNHRSQNQSPNRGIHELATEGKKIVSRPIVEPEQYNVQYTPNQYIIERNRNYKSRIKAAASLVDSAVGSGNVDHVSDIRPGYSDRNSKTFDNIKAEYDPAQQNHIDLKQEFDGRQPSVQVHKPLLITQNTNQPFSQHNHASPQRFTSKEQNRQSSISQKQNSYHNYQPDMTQNRRSENSLYSKPNQSQNHPFETIPEHNNEDEASSNYRPSYQQIDRKSHRNQQNVIVINSESESEDIGSSFPRSKSKRKFLTNLSRKSRVSSEFQPNPNQRNGSERFERESHREDISQLPQYKGLQSNSRETWNQEQNNRPSYVESSTAIREQSYPQYNYSNNNIQENNKSIPSGQNQKFLKNSNNYPGVATSISNNQLSYENNQPYRYTENNSRQTNHEKNNLINSDYNQNSNYANGSNSKSWVPQQNTPFYKQNYEEKSNAVGQNLFNEHTHQGESLYQPSGNQYKVIESYRPQQPQSDYPHSQSMIQNYSPEQKEYNRNTNLKDSSPHVQINQAKNIVIENSDQMQGNSRQSRINDSLSKFQDKPMPKQQPQIRFSSITGKQQPQKFNGNQIPQSNYFFQGQQSVQSVAQTNRAPSQTRLDPLGILEPNKSKVYENRSGIQNPKKKKIAKGNLLSWV